MAALYQNTVAPNHVNCAVVKDAVKEYIVKAHRVFGPAAMSKVSDVLIEFFREGSEAALATVGTHSVTGKIVGLIQFSMKLVTRRLLTIIKQTVPHELAHVICMANGWDMGHGRIWRQVCKMLGGDGAEFHIMAGTDRRYKHLYEARCAEGCSYWLTGTQKRLASTEGLEAISASGQRVVLTKKTLTGNMKPIE